MIQREREFCGRILFAPLFFLKNIYLCDYDEKTYCIIWHNYIVTFLLLSGSNNIFFNVLLFSDIGYQ
jgi:hypothetical protein